MRVRECFAGCALLSKHLAWRGCHVSRLMEAYPKKGVYVPSLDLEKPVAVASRLGSSVDPDKMWKSVRKSSANCVSDEQTKSP